MKTRVAVIFGGPGGEHEVSCASAKNILKALDRERFVAVPIVITLDGHWYRGADAEEYLTTGSVPPNAVSAPLSVERARHDVDVVFSIVHGTSGEDGALQGVCETAGLPYVGSNVLGSALGMDKATQKILLRATGIPVVETRLLLTTPTPEQATSIISDLGLPLFVKPSASGSSVGISKVKEATQFLPAVGEAFRHDRRVLIERAVPAARELEIAVLGNPDNFQTSVVGEIIPSSEFYDYHEKYLGSGTRTIIPAELAPGQKAQIVQYAMNACQTLDLAGLIRVDFLLSKESGELVLSEVNTLPGFTQISMYPKLWQASGVSYTDLMTRLIELAQVRYATAQRIARTAPLNPWWIGQ